MKSIMNHAFSAKGMYAKNKRKILLTSFFLAVLIIAGMFYSEDSGIQKKCKDTDGENLFTKGVILYSDEKGRHAEEDYCTRDERQVYEMTCKRTAFLSRDFIPEKKIFNCERGCINGTCVK